jgi:hypothetical protein
MASPAWPPGRRAAGGRTGSPWRDARVAAAAAVSCTGRDGRTVQAHGSPLPPSGGGSCRPCSWASRTASSQGWPGVKDSTTMPLGASPCRRATAATPGLGGGGPVSLARPCRLRKAASRTRCMRSERDRRTVEPMAAAATSTAAAPGRGRGPPRRPTLERASPPQAACGPAACPKAACGPVAAPAACADGREGGLGEPPSWGRPCAHACRPRPGCRQATGGQWPPIAAPPRALRLRAPLSLRVVPPSRRPAVPPRDVEPEIGFLRCYRCRCG